MSAPSGQPEQAPIVAMDDHDLMQRLCAMGQPTLLRAGETLCRHGDVADGLWLLLEGKLSIHNPGYLEDSCIEARADTLVLVGENGLFTAQRRNADVTASCDSKLVAISILSIRQRSTEEPAFAEAMERLTRERWVEPVLSRHAVFERVNDIDRLRLAKTFQRMEISAGNILIHKGEDHDGAYLVLDGCLFVAFENNLEDAAAETIASAHPGDLIHLGGLLHEYKSPYLVQAATPATLLYLSRHDFEPYTLQRPWIIQAILQYIRRPAHLQVMHPEDEYLWTTNRHIKLRRVSSKDA